MTKERCPTRSFLEKNKQAGTKSTNAHVSFSGSNKKGEAIASPESTDAQS